MLTGLQILIFFKKKKSSLGITDDLQTHLFYFFNAFTNKYNVAMDPQY